MNWTPLHRLCVSLNEDDPSYASSLQQFVDQLNVPTCTGTTPLHFAVIGDSFKLVVYLIVNKAKVNQKNNVGETPLHWAVQKDNERVVTFLLDNGADFTLCDNG
jgi:ankyrin repeat protein